MKSDYATAYHVRRAAVERQRRLRAAGQCINGLHGPVLLGVRCPECVAQHQRHDLFPASHRAHLAALRLQRELRAIAAA